MIEINKFYENIKIKDYIDAVNPSTLEKIGEIPNFNEENIKEVFLQGSKKEKYFKDLDFEKRKKMLLKWADNLEANKVELAKMISNEIAKNYQDSLKEVQRSIKYIKDTIMVFEKEIKKTIIIDPKDYDSEYNEGKKAYISRKPLGSILAISPFNYPVNLAISKIAPALLMGNIVYFKPATQGSYLAYFMVELFNKDNEKNILNIITGKGRELSNLLINRPEIKLIHFTGSTNVGKQIANNSGLVYHVQELGGKDDAIVFEDADLESTANEIVNGAFNYNGQRCTAIKRVIVNEKVHDKLLELVVAKVNELSISSDVFKNSKITPMINKRALDFVVDLINDAKDLGAKLHQEIKINKNLLYPVVISNVTKKMKIFTQEQFGPALPFVKYNNNDELIQIINSNLFGLQASIFSKDENNIDMLYNHLDVGTINFNASSSRGPDLFPFLGVKDSGIGTQGIKNSLLSFSREKLIVKKG